jgi:hypothetical protein
MALFTDGPINSTADLQNHDSVILDVATIEGIDLTAKMTLAQESIGDELLTFLLHNLARDRRSQRRRFIGLADVVVTGPLGRWHAIKSLALAYGDAYGHQLNERYQAKWQEFETQVQLSSQQYLNVGVGLVLDPVPKAAPPSISATAGNGNPARYYVVVSWVNESGHEGAPSDLTMIDTSAGATITFAMQNAPRTATGWYVYLGITPTGLMRQNTVSIPVGTSWQTTAPNLAQGDSPKKGQSPEWFLFNDRVLLRG